MKYVDVCVWKSTTDATCITLYEKCNMYHSIYKIFVKSWEKSLTLKIQI